MKYKIEKGIQKRPIRLVAFGPEGIGKSTFASQFPKPLFIDTEGGTHRLDVDRFPKPETWTDLLKMIDAVIEDSEEYKTLVIDTIDRAEDLLSNQLMQEYNVDTIDKVGGGYGRGWTSLQERFQKDFLRRLDTVIAKGVNVVLIAHALMRKFESPEDPPYDRWEMKLTKKVTPIVREWCDILLFINYEVKTVEENGKAKARGKAKRVMHANHSPTYDAKNRYGLPDTMPLSFEPLKEIYEGSTPPTKEKTSLQIDTPVSGPVDTTLEDPRDVLIRRLADHGIEQSRFEAWLVTVGRLAPGSTYMDLSGTQANNMLEHIEVILENLGGK